MLLFALPPQAHASWRHQPGGFRGLSSTLGWAVRTFSLSTSASSFTYPTRATSCDPRLVYKSPQFPSVYFRNTSCCPDCMKASAAQSISQLKDTSYRTDMVADSELRYSVTSHSESRYKEIMPALLFLFLKEKQALNHSISQG